MAESIFPESSGESSTHEIRATLSPRVFQRSAKDYTVWYALGGSVFILFAVVGFIGAIVKDTSPIQLQLMTTLPLLVGAGFIGKALSSRDPLLSVMLDDHAVTITKQSGQQVFPWEQIAWNTESVQPMTSTKQCTLYGTDGKVLVKIPAAVEGFGELIALINARIKGQPHAQADVVRTKRLRKQGIFLLATGAGFLVLLSLLMGVEIHDTRLAKQLAKEGVDGTATIVRKFYAPDGRTTRIEYRVDAKRPDGSQPDLVNAEFDPIFWESIAENAKLPVTYVPSDPDNSRAMFGQRDGGPNLGPMEKYIVFIGGGIMSLLMLGAGVMNLKGIDVVVDSQTKKIRIARSVQN